MIEAHSKRNVNRLNVLFGFVTEIVEDTTGQEPSPDWHLDRINPNLGNNLGTEYDSLSFLERSKTKLAHSLLKIYNFLIGAQINELFKARIFNVEKDQSALSFYLPGSLVKEISSLASEYPDQEMIGELSFMNGKKSRDKSLIIEPTNLVKGDKYEGKVSPKSINETAVGVFHKHPRYFKIGDKICKASDYGNESFSITDIQFFLKNYYGSNMFVIVYTKQNMENKNDEIKVAILAKTKEQGYLYGGEKIANELDWFGGWLSRLKEYSLREEIMFSQTKYKDLLLKLVSKLGFNYYEGTLGEGGEVEMKRF